MKSKEKLEFVQSLIKEGRKDESLQLDGFSEPQNLFFKNVNGDESLYTKGQELIKEGKVGFIMVAGGISSRMGLAGLRGNMVLGPVTKRTIFKYQIEKIDAMRRKLNNDIFLVVLTSPQVHEKTLETFKKANFFGMPPDQIDFVCQESLPIVDKNLQPILNQEKKVVEFPTGHGGLLKAIAKENIVEELKKRKIQFIYYFQYPNVLEQVYDPIAIAYHYQNRSDFSVKAISKCDATEKLGRILQKKGKYKVLEYYDITSISFEMRKALPANTGTYIISVSFLEKIINSKISLPYHILPLHNNKEAFKIEQYIFDLLDLCDSHSLIIIPRNDEFACVKTPKGINSIEAARLALSNIYKSWLKQVYFDFYQRIGVSDLVEISPLFASDFKEFNKRTKLEIELNVLLKKNKVRNANRILRHN